MPKKASKNRLHNRIVYYMEYNKERKKKKIKW